MARYAIDAATLVHLVTNELEVAPGHQLVAPNAIRSDALSLLYAAVRRGELTERVALEQHTRLTELKMRVLGDRVSRRTAWKLASQQGWDDLSAAEYLAVCSLQADALVTVDPAMAELATGIVPLAPLSALFS
jgi:predicted nucleic acid-binding protein